MTPQPKPAQRAAESILKEVATRGLAALTTKNVTALIERETQPQWQAIADAPKDGTRIIGLNNRNPSHYHPEIISWCWSTYGEDAEKKNWHSANHLNAYPTHWMPLPAPPSP